MNKILALGLILTIFAFIGCASHYAALPDRDESNQIVGITIDNDSDVLNLNIQANQSLNYTEDRISKPMGIVFSFSDTKIDGLRGLYTPPENGVIRYIRADAHAVNESPVATVYISLKADTPYGVTQNNGRLQVTFPMQPVLASKIAMHKKPAEVKPEPQKTQNLLPTATVLVKVNTESHEDALAVDVVADGTITKYNAFTLDKPARIVFDIFKIKSSHFEEQKIRVRSKVARQIRYCGHPDKLRLVIDTQKEYLSKYSSASTDTGLIIKVGKLQE
jgi:hypothetical protein